MFNSFIRRFRYCQVASPLAGSTQSGPRQTKRWRASLPTPNADAACSGVSYFLPMPLDHTAPRLLGSRAGGSMARDTDDLNDERTGGSDTETERVRGLADEGDEFDDDSDDLDDD